GRLVTAYVKRFEGTPEIAEAKQWIHNVHMTNVQIETICLQVETRQSSSP
ncbi:hypothetical protein L195_g049912, partial [Trifolium pratense]